MGISRQQLDQEIKNINRNLDQESRRTISAILTGNHYEMSLTETINYYNLNQELANEFWKNYNFDIEMKEKKKRGSKSSSIKAFLENNVGKTISGKDMVEELGITLPTFYNFFNNNRAYFKKVGRGNFEILNPEEERRKEK
jgi:hypothetical protein